jgi:hypothetical protein
VLACPLLIALGFTKHIAFEEILGNLCAHIHSSPPCDARRRHQWSSDLIS